MISRAATTGLLRGADSTESLGDELAAAGAEFCEGRLRVLGSAWDLTLVYKARTCIATMLELVTRGFFGSKAPHHRVAVWDLDGIIDSKGDSAMRVTAVVSQTDIVRCVCLEDALSHHSGSAPTHPCCRSFLHRHAAELGDLSKTSLEALGLARKPVVTVPADTSALAAFAAMLAAGVSAVGITSAINGPLVANLSVTDLRGLTAGGWGTLEQPIAEFLLQKNGEMAIAIELSERQVLVGRMSVESGGALAQEVVPLHFVRPSTTFGELLAKFDARGVHHLWVLDDEQRPVGIVTPTDVLKVRCLAAAFVESWLGAAEAFLVSQLLIGDE